MRTLLITAALAWSGLAQATVTLNDVEGYIWDIDEATGLDIINGTSDSYDNWPHLCVRTPADAGECESSNPAFYDASGVASGRLVVGSPQDAGGVSVSRTVYVPTVSTMGFARIEHKLTNTTGAPASRKVMIGSVFGDGSSHTADLGSDSGTLVTGTSDGGPLSAATLWFTTDDSSDGAGDPSLAHVVSGGGAVGATLVAQNPWSASSGTDNSEFLVEFDVTIPAGQTVILVTFESQQQNRAESRAAAEWISTSPAEIWEGMSAADLANVVNWDTGGGAMLTLSEADPGVAGGLNRWSVSGAEPGGTVYLVASARGGSFAVPICPGLSLDISSPRLLGNARADGSGNATLGASIPVDLAGMTLYFQAVDGAACAVSNVSPTSF